MQKFFNILMLVLTIIFIYSVFDYYFSNKNIETKNYNRSNLDKILKDKISGLKVLDNDTNDVIEFNNSLQIQTNGEKKKKFLGII